MAHRAVVFIDYQNMYRRARGAFGYEAELGHFGNFRPIALARLLAQDEDRELIAVRVYTGVPAQERQKKDYEIMQRRTSAWENDAPDIVKAFTRTKRYPPPEGREKGVDVALAVDFVALAIDEEYDVGIVASADTDLIPALELVLRRFEALTVESVGWDPIKGCEAPEPLDIPGGGVMRRKVTKEEFDRVADKRNFMQPQKVYPGQSGRRLPPGRRR